MTVQTGRWSFQDCAGSNKGYCRILLDGMDVGIDVFPFRKGADPTAIKAKAGALVDVLNAADYWRQGCDETSGLGMERLEDAVDALRRLSADCEDVNRG